MKATAEQVHAAWLALHAAAAAQIATLSFFEQGMAASKIYPLLPHMAQVAADAVVAVPATPVAK